MRRGGESSEAGVGERGERLKSGNAEKEEAAEPLVIGYLLFASPRPIRPAADRLMVIRSGEKEGEMPGGKSGNVRIFSQFVCVVS